MTPEPTFGALPEPGGTRFRVWAPDARLVEVVMEDRGRRHPLGVGPGGIHEGFVRGASAGDRYRLALDGGPPLPDPASRFQPEGVHGASEIVDPRFPWSDAAWHGVPLEELVIYELHVGTFTPEGSFAAAAARLPDLRELGVTAVELMPVADFPGERNWGYDGAALFAPARCYGTPDDLRRFVDVAHGLGLAVHLDVVYNHFGPDGAYAAAFSGRFFSERHRSPWGAGINLDGPHSPGVRDFFVANALHWVCEYHVDGLRLDATHAMVDESPRHFVAELATRVRETLPQRNVLLAAEDSRNLAAIVRVAETGGWGCDAVWSDDFHHEVRRLVAGDSEGYFVDFRGNVSDLATILRHGWLYTGQHSAYGNRPRGTDPDGIEPGRFVFFLQNHDQVGNRAFGERLNHQVEPATYRAASALLLLAPQTPLLFMGQEWAASTPFRFFTDHGPELAPLVTEGRRREFRAFSAFSGDEARARIPDPQARSTFEASRLRWEERDLPLPAATRRLYRALLALRRSEPALREPARDRLDVAPLDDGTLAMRRQSRHGAPLLVVVRVAGAGEVVVPPGMLRGEPEGWTPILSTEDPDHAPDPLPVNLEPAGGSLRIRFARPGAVVLRDGQGRA